jgi:predicted dehydrogenase/L-amino acid N-acyltransferase YncA
MRVAVIGQGSIGRRHAQIVLDLGHQAVVFDPDPSVQGPPGATRAETLDAALDEAGAAVIASPSSEHARHARRALERGVPAMIEKPLATDVARAVELECLARDRGVLLTVAMNLRHHPGVLAVRELMHERVVGDVLSARAWCGSWLPDWRPGTDYRTSYSARSELGGGVLLDVAIHELDYLLWLLGPAAALTAVVRRISGLEIDVEDVAVIALELKDGSLAHVTVDYFDRSYHRGCRLVGDQGTVHWSWEQETLTLVGPKGTVEQRSVSSDVAPTYRRQLEAFLAAVRGEAEAVVDPREARHVLSVVEAARLSSDEGRRVVISPPVTLRPAGEGDSARILEWRNDADTRRWSRTEQEVSAEEHTRWLARTLDDPGCTIWIGESDGSAIGQIRATRDEAGSAELHVTVAPEARGRGLGTVLILEAAGRVLNDPSVSRVVAHVNPGNQGSLRAFTRAGFEPAGADQAGFQRLERKPSR